MFGFVRILRDLDSKNSIYIAGCSILNTTLERQVHTIRLLFPPAREAGMDRYIHRENLSLLRKRLTEAHDDATHKVLLKLLAEEEAKEAFLPKGKDPN
jgi:hypothetical protein